MCQIARWSFLLRRSKDVSRWCFCQVSEEVLPMAGALCGNDHSISLMEQCRSHGLPGPGYSTDVFPNRFWTEGELTTEVAESHDISRGKSIYIKLLGKLWLAWSGLRLRLRLMFRNLFLFCVTFNINHELHEQIFGLRHVASWSNSTI